MNNGEWANDQWNLFELFGGWANNTLDLYEHNLAGVSVTRCIRIKQMLRVPTHFDFVWPFLGVPKQC